MASIISRQVRQRPTSRRPTTAFLFSAFSTTFTSVEASASSAFQFSSLTSTTTTTTTTNICCNNAANKIARARVVRATTTTARRRSSSNLSSSVSTTSATYSNSDSIMADNNNDNHKKKSCNNNDDDVCRSDVKTSLVWKIDTRTKHAQVYLEEVEDERNNDDDDDDDDNVSIQQKQKQTQQQQDKEVAGGGTAAAPAADAWKHEHKGNNNGSGSSISNAGGGDNDDDDADADIINAIIPESVLQYQRQLRKVQHAQKVGQALSPNDLNVVYVDNDIVVVNKPSGVLTVPGIKNRHNSIANLVYDKYVNVNNNNCDGGDSNNNNNCDNSDKMKVEHTIVHRLDMDTSGLVVFGLNLDATKLLHEQFRNDNVIKEYEAVVMGHILHGINSGRINLPLQRDHQHPPFMRISTKQSEMDAANAVSQLQKNGFKKLIRKSPKSSCTEFEIIERGYYNFNNEEEDRLLPYTRIRLIPKTGRTHQLRVHCAALGYPIVGDPTYGLYGEANLKGGLLHNVCTRIVATDSATSDNDDGDNQQDQKSQSVNNNIDNDGCSLDVQKAWLQDYPPNKSLMCLHACKLAFQHPITRENLEFDVEPPPYFFQF